MCLPAAAAAAAAAAAVAAAASCSNLCSAFISLKLLYLWLDVVVAAAAAAAAAVVAVVAAADEEPPEVRRMSSFPVLLWPVGSRQFWQLVLDSRHHFTTGVDAFSSGPT